MKKNYIKHLFTALLLLCATVANAHDFEVGGIYYNITSSIDKTVEVAYKGMFVSGYTNEYTGDIVIPESVIYNGTNYSVTNIGYSAFYGCPGLTSITIPNSVTSIGDYAFYDCSGLTSVIIGENVTSVGSGAFNNCNAIEKLELHCKTIGNWFYNKSYIKEVVIGNSVTSIGDNAFRDCSGLTSITIPNSVTSIGVNAFYGCSGLTSVTIPNSVTSIGAGAFQRCSGLTSVVIGNSVESIGSSAFEYCSGLTSITIPNSVTSIGDNAFYGCSALTSITIPNSVASIGSYVFAGTAWDNNLPDGLLYVGKVLYKYKGTMPQYTSIIVEEGTLSIAPLAFYNYSRLASITIPNSVTSIGAGAFQGCSRLTSIIIPNSVTSIGNQVFLGCSGLTSVVIPNGVTSIGRAAFSDCSGLTSVTIGNGVTSIGVSAFYGCSRLASITIPNSVTSFGDNAFKGCSGLETVINLSNLTFSKGSTDYGYVAYYANELYNFPNASKEGDYIFCKPNNVNTLFYYFGNKTELTLPADYKGEGYVIGENVFKDNKTITCIIIPNSVTSIGNGAFNNCLGLTSITIPNSITSIGEQAFVGCENLKEVINCSKLNIVAGAESHGGVALYAERVLSSYLHDGVEFVYDNIKDFTTLYYARTFANETDWEPWYMPFDVELSDIENELDVASLNNIHQYDDNEDDEIDRTELEAIKLNNGTLYANYPYIVRAKTAGEKEFVFEDVTVQPFENNSIDCSSVTTKFTFTGSNNKMYNNGCYGLLGNSLVPETGEAALSAVTSLTQLSNDKVYTLRSARTFLLYSDNISDKLCTGNGAQVGDVSRNVYDTNQYFKIEKINGKYYLYSVAAGKYVSNNGTFVATPTDALTIVNVGGEYQWNLRIGGNCLNSQDRGQTANGILVDSWTTTDAGNCYIIEELEASLAPNRWYLNIEARNPMFKAPANIRLFIRGEGATAIEEVEVSCNDEDGAPVIYDLAGRKVTNPTKGIYIVNGKRVLIK